MGQCNVSNTSFFGSDDGGVYVLNVIFCVCVCVFFFSGFNQSVHVSKIQYFNLQNFMFYKIFFFSLNIFTMANGFTIVPVQCSSKLMRIHLRFMHINSSCNFHLPSFCFSYQTNMLTLSIFDHVHSLQQHCAAIIHKNIESSNFFRD